MSMSNYYRRILGMPKQTATAPAFDLIIPTSETEADIMASKANMKADKAIDKKMTAAQMKADIAADKKQLAAKVQAGRKGKK